MTAPTTAARALAKTPDQRFPNASSLAAAAAAAASGRRRPPGEAQPTAAFPPSFAEPTPARPPTPPVPPPTPPRPAGAGPGTTDGDVRFTAYHATLMAPDCWYPLLAFVHRADPFRDPATGGLVDPAAELRSRAHRALAGQDAPYRPTSPSERFPLARDDEFLLVPWIENGAVDPPEAVARWRTPIDQITFHMRVAGAVGQQVRGGMQILRGVVLLGTIEFTTTVLGGPETAPPTSRPAAARRFRNVFVSYSHRDEQIVSAVLDWRLSSGPVCGRLRPPSVTAPARRPTAMTSAPPSCSSPWSCSGGSRRWSSS